MIEMEGRHCQDIDHLNLQKRKMVLLLVPVEVWTNRVLHLLCSLDRAGSQKKRNEHLSILPNLLFHANECVLLSLLLPCSQNP
ncbi:hypothetical protein LguiB_025553 [Lonicera macranthoides]